MDDGRQGLLAIGDGGSSELSDGRYQLTHKLGARGPTTVWGALSTTTQQRVVIKCLSQDADATTVARFQREIGVVATLAHPHLERLVDAGTDGHRRVRFSVFDHVGGRTLRELSLADGPMRPSRAARIMAQVLDGLCAVHAAGVLHRAIGPATIKLSPTRASDHAVLVDFGGAGFSKASSDQGLSAPSHVVAPLHTPPERLLGQPYDERSDIYAWGLTAIELITGHPVVHGTPLQVREQHLSPQPHRVPTGLPAGLSAVLVRAVAKEPTARFATAQAALDALTGWLDASGAAFVTEAVEALPVPARSRAPSWGGLVGVAVVAALAGGVAGWSANPVNGSDLALHPTAGAHRWVAPSAALGVDERVAEAGTPGSPSPRRSTDGSRSAVRTPGGAAVRTPGGAAVRTPGGAARAQPSSLRPAGQPPKKTSVAPAVASPLERQPPSPALPAATAPPPVDHSPLTPSERAALGRSPAPARTGPCAAANTSRASGEAPRLVLPARGLRATEVALGLYVFLPVTSLPEVRSKSLALTLGVRPWPPRVGDVDKGVLSIVLAGSGDEVRWVLGHKAGFRVQVLEVTPHRLCLRVTLPSVVVRTLTVDVALESAPISLLNTAKWASVMRPDAGWRADDLLSVVRRPDGGGVVCPRVSAMFGMESNPVRVNAQRRRSPDGTDTWVFTNSAPVTVLSFNVVVKDGAVSRAWREEGHGFSRAVRVVGHAVSPTATGACGWFDIRDREQPERVSFRYTQAAAANGVDR